MSLQVSNLRQSLGSLFDQSTMPNDQATAVQRWASAYALYAQKAQAGPLILSGPLRTVVAPGTFIESLDGTLRTAWATATWLGPGATGITAAVPPLRAYLTPLTTSLISSYDRDLAPTLIAEALHTYTMNVVVTVTPLTGTPFPMTLV